MGRLKSKIISFMMIGAMLALPESVSAAEVSSTTEDTEDYAAEQLITTKNDNVLENTIKESVEKTGNKYPIVLVHGLGGWGNKEVLNENYWGGQQSYRDTLNAEGYEVYTPTIGPVASNWDRACELYAYLVGGTVDYGQAHADKCGHNRYGRTYPGVLKDLGTVDADGNMKKVHLVGHSMGGETVRVLAQLLENGSAEEVSAAGDSVSSLFKGGKHFIESITTLCTPHDGSQYDELMDVYTEPFAHKMVAGIASLEGGKDINDVKLDLQLDQWGLKKQAGESEESYINRVEKSNIWKETKDLSVWDLSLEGAKELNSWVKTQDDIYYFSVACVDTHKDLITGYQVPNINMHPMMLKSSFVMGAFTQNTLDKVVVDNSWWRNDGIVAVRSAIAPHEGSTDKIVEYNGTAQKGVWNYLGEIKNMNHIEIMAAKEPIHKRYMMNKFRSWAEMLSQL